VGSVDTLAAAREAYRAQKPSLVLLDLWLPDGDGLDFAGELRMQSASARIIACTVRKDAVALHKCERMGLNGMICKEPLLAKNLRLAMRTVLEGRRWVSPEMAARMASLRTDPNAYYKILSDREQELLPLLGRGDSDASIAPTRCATSGSESCESSDWPGRRISSGRLHLWASCGRMRARCGRNQ
jgi:DNA-binding NarL/FixJ family response regulator